LGLNLFIKVHTLILECYLEYVIRRSQVLRVEKLG